MSARKIVEVDVLASGTANRGRTRRGRKNPRRAKDAGGGRMVGIPAGVSNMAIPAPVRTNGNTSFRITRTEVFAAVEMTAAFVGTLFPIAPSFIPWITGPAQSFSKWRFTRFMVDYQTVASTTNGGLIALGFGYDMSESPPADAIQATSYHENRQLAPWGMIPPMKLDITKFRQNWYPYAGSSFITGLTGVDQNVYVPAYLSIATSGGTDGTAAGLVSVTYTIELADPIAAAKQPDN